MDSALEMPLILNHVHHHVPDNSEGLSVTTFMLSALEMIHQQVSPPPSVPSPLCLQVKLQRRW